MQANEDIAQHRDGADVGMADEREPPGHGITTMGTESDEPWWPYGGSPRQKQSVSINISRYTT